MTTRIGPWAFALLLMATAAVAQDSQSDEEQTNSCGAVMCLMGGSGISECGPYLARYFSLIDQNPQTMYEKRKNFLDQCPGSDGNFNATAAQMGEVCQPENLVQNLNMQLQNCTACLAQEAWQGQGQQSQWNNNTCPSCAARDGQQAQAVCGTWYSTENVVTRPPHLVVSDCLGGGGAFQQNGFGCTYVWEITPATD